MKRKFWIVSIISIICIFFTNGCSIMTQMTSVADATSSYEDKDLLVPHNLQNMANWSSYEIWVNENISRGLLDPSSVNDKSVHTKLIISPLYMNENDTLGVRNKKTLGDWLNWMLTDNSNICYLAIREISKDLNYDDAYKQYKKYFNDAKKTADELFENSMFSFESTNVQIKMENPMKVYKNGDLKYGLDNVINVLRQSRRGLTISKGIAELTK